MTKHQFVADRIREHVLSLTQFANKYADSDETRFLLSVASSMANIAEELTKEPKPAMAPGDTRPKFGPKPSSTVLNPKPAPKLPGGDDTVDACANVLNMWNEAHTEAKAKADALAKVKALAAAR